MLADAEIRATAHRLDQFAVSDESVTPEPQRLAKIWPSQEELLLDGCRLDSRPAIGEVLDIEAVEPHRCEVVDVDAG